MLGTPGHLVVSGIQTHVYATTGFVLAAWGRPAVPYASGLNIVSMYSIIYETIACKGFLKH